MGQVQFKEVSVNSDGYYRPKKMCIEVSADNSTCTVEGQADISEENAKLMNQQYYFVNSPCKLETLSMKNPINADNTGWYIPIVNSSKNALYTSDELKQLVYMGSKTMAQWASSGMVGSQPPMPPKSFCASVTPCPPGASWCSAQCENKKKATYAAIVCAILLVIFMANKKR